MLHYLLRISISIILFLLTILLNVRYANRFEILNIWTLNLRNKSLIAVPDKSSKTNKQIVGIKNLVKSYYITTSGNLKKEFTSSEYKIIDIAENGYARISYNKTGNKIFYKNFKTKKSFHYDTVCYPYMFSSGEYIALISSDGISVDFIDNTGENLNKKIKLAKILTTIDTCKNKIVLGYLDGTVIIWDSNKNIIIDKKFDQYKIPVIKAVKFSDDGKYCAILSGLHDEELIILKTKNARTIYKKKTGLNRRTEIDMSFSPDSKYIVMQTAAGIKLINVKRKKMVFNKDFGFSDKNFRCVLTDISLKNQFISVLINYTESVQRAILLNRHGDIFWESSYNTEIINGKFIENNNKFIIMSDNKILCYKLDGLY